MEFAPHDVAVILRLLGQSPTQVSATGGSLLRKKSQMSQFQIFDFLIMLVPTFSSVGCILSRSND